MTIIERVDALNNIFKSLQLTNSRVKKQVIVDLIPAELRDDFDYCLEILAGKHKLGYRYEYVYSDNPKEFDSIKELYNYLQEPLNAHNLSRDNICSHLAKTCLLSDFLEPLCNREFKLGIGNSLIEPDITAPMLAKKFDSNLPYGELCITEKLDGNRCISYYDGEQWQFVSRNGKRMNVEFDMSGLPEELIYDGECISPEQDELSDYIYTSMLEKANNVIKKNTDFNSTSGLINRRTVNKKLVYRIFDIQDGSTYKIRRQLLDRFRPIADNVKILPLLGIVTKESMYTADNLLDLVVSAGGEGIMLNVADAPYISKRTDKLLKYKPVYTIDMEVVNMYPGTGKYDGLIGGIVCEAFTEDGKFISCCVGSGLTDMQRILWHQNREAIIGKIVEVEYFSLSQDLLNKGTNIYSLRFPRLKRVRDDKIGTSEY